MDYSKEFSYMDNDFCCSDLFDFDFANAIIKYLWDIEPKNSKSFEKFFNEKKKNFEKIANKDDLPFRFIVSYMILTNFDELDGMVENWQQNNLDMFKKDCNIVFDKIIKTRKTKYVTKWVHFMVVFNMNPDENKIGNFGYDGSKKKIPLNEDYWIDDLMNILYKTGKLEKPITQQI